LRRGRNVLAVIVLDMSRVAHRPALLGPPCSVMTYTGGFVLEGEVIDRDGAVLADLQTDAHWRVAVDHGHRFQNENTTFEVFGYKMSGTLNVSNLLDKEYSEGNYNLAEPRSYMFTLGMKF